jgi:probable F420-dependent oxidoreductase
MRIGFFAPHTGRGVSRSELARACDVAEDGGADSLWAVDHIAIPYGFKAEYPYAAHQFGSGPDEPLEWWDCLTVLTYLAARTERVLLGTGVVILPYRHPLATAKTLATIDALSEGRVLFGVGVGWMKDEFAALQLDYFHQRGRVMDEQIEILRRAWTQDRVNYAGEFYEFPDVSVTPKPARPGGPPILVGGNSPAALRRAVRLGDGWHGLMLLPDEVRTHTAELARIAAEEGHAGEMPVTLLMGLRLTRDDSIYPALDHEHRQAALLGTPEQLIEQLIAYRDAGVEHIQLAASADDTFGDLTQVDTMDFVLREVWPAVTGA